MKPSRYSVAYFRSILCGLLNADEFVFRQTLIQVTHHCNIGISRNLFLAVALASSVLAILRAN
jgi:hypothetical protein